MSELSVLAKLDLQRRGAHVTFLRIRLLADERQILVLCPQHLLDALQDCPEVLCGLALRTVGLLQQSDQRLSPVSWTSILQQTPQWSERARPHVALAGEEALFWPTEVNAHRQHLGPGLAQALGLLHSRGNRGKFLGWLELLVLQRAKGAAGYFQEAHRPIRDASDQVLVVILQQALGYDAEATRQQRLTRLLPVLPDGLFHGTPGLERGNGVLPETRLQHYGQLGLCEQVTFAVGPEDEHREEPLALIPLLSVVHRLHKEVLVHAKDRVIRHVALGGSEIGCCEGLYPWPHLHGVHVLQCYVVVRVQICLEAKLALAKFEELLSGGRWQRLTSAWRICTTFFSRSASRGGARRAQFQTSVLDVVPKVGHRVTIAVVHHGSENVPDSLPMARIATPLYQQRSIDRLLGAFQHR
mmetsp:Transcript_23493/g.61788  ORF Transcript_23493/g.61788 Transcript_23493/m.61788 type:complete len:413 (-) Transcript_23493:119-1357(-)